MAGMKRLLPEQLLACRWALASQVSREDLLAYRTAVDAVSFLAERCTFVQKDVATPGGLERELATLCGLLGVDLASPPRAQDLHSNGRRRKGGGGWCIEIDLPAAEASRSVCIAIECSEQSEDLTFLLLDADGEGDPVTMAVPVCNRGCLDEGSLSLKIWTSLLRLSTFLDGAAVRTTPPPSRLPPKPQGSVTRS
jgi:hypothetical protein